MSVTPTALITGAARGIGRSTALALAKSGCQIVINYHTSQHEAQQLAQELGELGAQSLCIQADVSDPRAVQQMVDAAEKRFGGIDILVNNAGIAQQKLFQDLTDEDIDRMLDVTVKGAMYACRAVLPGMIRAKRGSIINVSSMWGQVGASCEAAYSAAKAAVIGLTKALAKEVGPCGIRVNCVCPGVIQTQMNRHLEKSALDELREETPLGRLGTPEDVAACIAFLASKEAGFVTGQILGVNGGLII